MVDEFEIPPLAATALCDHCDNRKLYTRLTYLIQDGLDGVRKSEGVVFIKRIGPNLYQHINGPGITYHVPIKEPKPKISKRALGEAMVSVKILFSLKYDPVDVLCGLSGKWHDHVIEAAINQVYA